MKVSTTIMMTYKRYKINSCLRYISLGCGPKNTSRVLPKTLYRRCSHGSARVMICVSVLAKLIQLSRSKNELRI